MKWNEKNLNPWFKKKSVLQTYTKEPKKINSFRLAVQKNFTSYQNVSWGPSI